MNIQEQLKDKTIFIEKLEKEKEEVIGLKEKQEKEHEEALADKNEKIDGHVKVLEVMKQTMVILRDKLVTTFDEIETKNKQFEEIQKA